MERVEPYWPLAVLRVRRLPEPDVIAAEIADDLEAAMEQFAEIAGELKQPTAQ